MFRNYLRTAVRNILRNRVYSFIKILGLSIGIAAGILIYLFVADELSFDNFHENGGRLFRIVQVHFDPGSGKETGRQQFMPAPMGPVLESSIPGIEHQTRYVNNPGTVRHEDKLFRETLTLVDSPFFEMFSFPLISGNPRTVLADDHCVVLSRASAKKYFDERDPLGQTLSIAFGQVVRDFTVTGVAEDIPANSTLQFDILIPFHHLPAATNDPDILDNWDRWYCPFFVQLRSHLSMKNVEEGLARFGHQYFSETIRRNLNEGHEPFRFCLQKMGDIHLDSRIAGTAGLTPSFILLAIALAILLIACVNFMNLSIGLSSARSLEVGMRKVLGARQRQLIRQFCGEALLMSFLAVILGLGVAELLLPKFNVLSGKSISLTALFVNGHWLALLALAAFTGVAAGAYPAVVMSSFRPVEIIKGRLKVGGKTIFTRGLVVLQFALSIILAISAVSLGRQVSFMVNTNPGYASDGLVVILTQENEQQRSERFVQRFRSEILPHSRIQGMTASNREFGLFLPGTSLELGGRRLHYRYTRVDPQFISTMKIRLLQGRDFSSNAAADRDSVIVNQRFMDELGADYRPGDTLGDMAKGFPYNCRIIGAIENCHIQSLRSEIDPLLLYVGEGFSATRDRFSRVFVRIDSENIKETMGLLEKAWEKTQPDKPFSYYFQDDALKSLYDQEKRWGGIVGTASFFSIALSCLGIFGLTSLTLSRRVKEIGVRKVLGASVEQIVYLAVKEFVVLTAIANVLALPVAYLILNRVLENYPYRIEIGFLTFFLAGLASILIAVSTILFLSVKAALRNPADSLRYE
jgi:putative ABC transport system permease protein